MRLSFPSFAALSVFVAIAVVSTAHARPDYCEQGETMDLPEGAQQAQGQGTLERLNGTLEGSPAKGEGDFGDMYLIDITDPADFSMRLVSGGGVRPQLWLFAGPGLSIAEGTGLLANNGVDLPGGFEGAILENESTDGSGIVLTEPGLYYIAITGQEPTDGGDGRVPQAFNPFGEQTPGIQDIFAFGPGYEISGPDGPGGDFPIVSWRGIGDSGTYSVEASGVTLIPNPCPADASRDGTVGFIDILLVLGNWGPCPPPPACAFAEDFNGFVEGLALIPQQACFPTCPPEDSWQAFNDDPYGAGSLILADPDPAQSDNVLSIRGFGNDDLVRTFGGAAGGRFIFTTDLFVPPGPSFGSTFSLLNDYVPNLTANFSLRLMISESTGQVMDVDSGATLPLVVNDWIPLTVLIDLDTDTQTVFYNDEVLVVKSWTDGAGGGGELTIDGMRLRWDPVDSGATDAFYDDSSLCPLIGAPPCPGDVNGDNVVGFGDLLDILAQWGGCP